jgi:hypothetical protein
MSLPFYAPNPYEDSSCQETHYPSERFFAFFSACQGLARRQSVACSALLSVYRCHPEWLHHTRLEARSPPGW